MIRKESITIEKKTFTENIPVRTYEIVDGEMQVGCKIPFRINLYNYKYSPSYYTPTISINNTISIHLNISVYIKIYLVFYSS